MKLLATSATLGLLGASLFTPVTSTGLRGSPHRLTRSLFGPPEDSDEEIIVNPRSDPYLWLEDIRGNESLAWVEEQNNITISSIESHPMFDELYETLEAISTSDERIPYVVVRHGLLYNFWRDMNNERGILRRTTIESYKTDNPNWETVLDIDALSEEENEAWVYQGLNCLLPEEVHCMISLSRGGQDAAVLREFNLESMSFVTDGFVVPEALTDLTWKDEDTLWIGAALDENSTTESGYARLVMDWKRGTPLEDATIIFEGNFSDLGSFAVSEITPEGTYDMIVQYTSFQTQIYYLITDDELQRLDLPEDAILLRFFKGRMIVSVMSDWNVTDTVYKAGSVLAIELESFLEGDRRFDFVFQPSERVAFDGISSSSSGIDNYIIYTTLDNVSSRMYRVTVEDGNWTQEEIELPGLGTANIEHNSGMGSTFMISYSDFLTPTSLYEVMADGTLEKLKSTPEHFDAEGVQVDQYEATSKDGTQIPYYIIKPADYVEDGNNPTVLYGYGGFAVSLRPSYGAASGSAWIERGGVYVVANIRGGGEFGPEWHQAAVRENHQNNFDDFAAVAQDLISRNVTSPSGLGIRGGSQGGLLVGGTFVQNPDLFGAVACQVPLLDMRRFNELLRGASWVDEYGDPDTDDWENFIRDWSPYHNLDEEETYPKVLFTTSTNDDRVHPAHARKMAAKMLDMGHPVYFYEATEGGHGGGASLNQRAYQEALVYTYMWKQLGTAPATDVMSMDDNESNTVISRNPDLF